MASAGQSAGPAERIGAMILRLDVRLRLPVGVDSTDGIVVSHAGHHDVAFPHLWKAAVRVGLVRLRRLVHRGQKSSRPDETTLCNRSHELALSGIVRTARGMLSREKVDVELGETLADTLGELSSAMDEYATAQTPKAHMHAKKALGRCLTGPTRRPAEYVDPPCPCTPPRSREIGVPPRRQHTAMLQELERDGKAALAAFDAAQSAMDARLAVAAQRDDNDNGARH